MIQYRKYKSYEEYLKHQRKKLDTQCDYFKSEFNARLVLIKKRIECIIKSINVNENKRVLCLGARLGEEVKAFNDFGFDAIGIDINPGINNKLVVKGDFHKIPFPDNSFDYLYCNCLDHAFDLEKVNTECDRVLKDNCYMFIELGKSDKLKIEKEGKDHIKKANSYEAVIWDKMESVIDCFKAFKRVKDFDTDESYYCFILRKK